MVLSLKPLKKSKFCQNVSLKCSIRKSTIKGWGKSRKWEVLCLVFQQIVWGALSKAKSPLGKSGLGKEAFHSPFPQPLRGRETWVVSALCGWTCSTRSSVSHTGWGSFPHSRSTSWSWSESGALCWPLMSSERRAYGLAIAARPLVAIFQNHMNSWNPGLCWRSPVCSAPVMPVLLQDNWEG